MVRYSTMVHIRALWNLRTKYMFLDEGSEKGHVVLYGLRNQTSFLTLHHGGHNSIFCFVA